MPKITQDTKIAIGLLKEQLYTFIGLNIELKLSKYGKEFNYVEVIMDGKTKRLDKKDLESLEEMLAIYKECK